MTRKRPVADSEFRKAVKNALTPKKIEEGVDMIYRVAMAKDDAEIMLSLLTKLDRFTQGGGEEYDPDVWLDRLQAKIDQDDEDSPQT